MSAAGTRVGLGTVQWGLDYGIANRSGQTGAREIGRILELAEQHGVGLIDTAHVYGEAEHRLGEFRKEASAFSIVTKTLPVNLREISSADVSRVQSAFRSSLSRLQRDSVYGLLVHSAADLLAPGGERLWQALEHERAHRRVTKLGVSVYTPEELQAVRSRFALEIVQLPFNLYDRRFEESGALRELEQAGVEVHVRSVFLQGLLVMPPPDLPEHFASIREHQAKLHADLRDSGLTPLEGALLHCLHQPGISRLILGCDTCAQLEEILRAAGKAGSAAPLSRSYSVSDVRITEPSRWPVPIPARNSAQPRQRAIVADAPVTPKEEI